MSVSLRPSRVEITIKRDEERSSQMKFQQFGNKIILQMDKGEEVVETLIN